MKFDKCMGELQYALNEGLIRPELECAITALMVHAVYLLGYYQGRQQASGGPDRAPSPMDP